MARVDFQGTARFRVLGRLGAGASGDVYSALDRDRNARVALKVLRELTHSALLQLKNEFRTLADLQHPGVVSLGELHEDAGRWFFTMELVEGVGLLPWIRGSEAEVVDRLASGGAAFDESRLRKALGQLAAALAAVHAAGCVHRDVKPTNVLVDAEGQIKLLDFGFATEARRGKDWTDGLAVGSPAYMAPEQAAGGAVGPAADWYAFGVVMFEALTGQLPLDGKPTELLALKQRKRAPQARAFEPKAPADLDALCERLLAIDPAQRPGAAEILAALESPALHKESSGVWGEKPPFVGRARELEELAGALAQVERGDQVSVLVRGESGVGKSALVQHFLASAGDSAPPLVLQGRCYERESVPFKAVDGIIDGVSRLLRGLPRTTAAALLPAPRAALLAQAFPVLSGLPVLSEGEPPPPVSSPQEQRQRLFGALRDLLGRLAERRALVLLVDDLQWADADSMALLGEVLCPPGAPAVLLLATVRSSGELPLLPGDVRHLELGELDDGDARALAERLLERTPNAAVDTASVVRESGGHPMFIEELVRRAGATQARTTSLEEALRDRVSGLGRAERGLLEALALGGQPLSERAASHAAELSLGAVGPVVKALRSQRLVRTQAVRGQVALEPMHDRVRQAVLAGLDDAGRRALHGRLQSALEAEGGEAEALAVHALGSGDLARASASALAAAHQAVAALAFERAARLFELALGAMPRDHAERSHLQEQRGDALANAGRGKEAADAYRAATDRAPPAKRVELERRAAEELLRSGHMDEGLASIDRLLASVGVKLASSPRRALLSLLYTRARLRIRGLEFRNRPVAEIPPAELQRIDVVWSAANGLAMVDVIRATDLQSRQLLLALEAGEATRVGRALAAEVAFIGAPGPSAGARVADVLGRARAVAHGLADRRLQAQVVLYEGVAAFLRGDWVECRERMRDGEARLREEQSGLAWELVSAQLFGVWSLAFLGEIDELGRRVSSLLREALERGDLYAATAMRTGLANLAWLVRDEPAIARARVEEARLQWSQQRYQFQHYWHLLAEGNCDLYEGHGTPAQLRTLGDWPELAASGYLRVQNMRVEAWHLRARAAVAAALESPARGREALLGEAEAAVRKLGRERVPWAEVVARSVAGAIAAARGAQDRAMAELSLAESAAVGAHMRLYEWSARRARALLAGDAAQVAAQDQLLRSAGAHAPARLAQMLLPGLGER